MTPIIQQIRLNLADVSGKEAYQTSFGHIVLSVIRDISKQAFADIKPLEKEQIFALCEQLLESGDGAERVIAFDWAFRIRKQFEVTDFERFETWIAKYVNDWGSCDDFCTHAFGYFMLHYPQSIETVMAWTGSENRWFRRAAAVVMIYSVRQKQHVEAAFRIADKLLLDQDNLVQKGYGWMLKEIGKRDPLPVFNYVMKHKAVMPRTALRYAIEKLEPSLRQQAMAK